jgi:hypothetical protein
MPAVAARPLAGTNTLRRKQLVIYSWYPVTDEALVVQGRFAAQGLASASPVAAIATKAVAQALASRAG